VDGNRQQIEAITAEAARRGVTVTVICDFVHVLEYTWKAAWSFFDKGDPDAEAWVATQAVKILQGKAAQVAAGIRRRATTFATPRRARGSRRLRGLPHRQETAPGLRNRPRRRLADRHRGNRGRLPSPGQRQDGHHRARWGLDGAEAILKLRALISNGDFQQYWRFHLRKNTNGSTTHATATTTPSPYNKLTPGEPHPSRLAW